MNRGLHVHVVNDDDEQMSSCLSDITSANERRSKKHKANNVGKIEWYMEKWCSSLSMRNEEAKLRVLYLKKKIAKLEGKSLDTNGSQSDVSDPYSMAACLNILNGTDGVSNEVYVKAMKAFKDPHFRMSFVLMPECRRLPILEQLKSLNTNGSQSGVPDPYSMVVCLNILNGIDGVSNEVYFKAMKAFEDPHFRMSFVLMPECRRLPILEVEE